MALKMAQKPASTVAPTDRVKQSFPKLKKASELVNKASDNLNASVASINAILKNIGLGVPSWFEFDSGQNHDIGYSWSQEIGYAKVSGKWGVAIRSTSHEWSSEPEEEAWAFGDAPRSLRLKAARYIPDLLEKLIQDATDVAAQIDKQTEDINAVAETILSLGPEQSEGAK